MTFRQVSLLLEQTFIEGIYNINLNQNSREGHESFGIKKEEKKENSKGGLIKSPLES